MLVIKRLNRLSNCTLQLRGGITAIIKRVNRLSIYKLVPVCKAYETEQCIMSIDRFLNNVVLYRGMKKCVLCVTLKGNPIICIECQESLWKNWRMDKYEM